MITSARRAALSRALLATTAFCGLIAQPAAAQSGITPSFRPAPDDNGVDVITGELHVPLQSVSIGRPGESGLTYSTGIINGAKQDTFVLEATGGGTVAIVNIHGRTATFTRNSAGVYVPDDADGSTFELWNNDFIYTARDGTRIEFLKEYGDGLVGARGYRIIRPDGEIIQYYYKKGTPPSCPTSDICTDPNGNGGVRVQSITSSLGYQLKATYAEQDYATDSAGWSYLTKVTAVNNAVDFCKADEDSCSFSKVWPELFLGHTESGTIITDTLKDSLSKTVTVTSTAQGPIAIASPADKPGDAPDLHLTYHPDGRVEKVTRGGGTWSYAYSGNVTTVTQPLGKSGIYKSRIYVWDTNLRRVESVKDELGRETKYKHDANGRLERTTFDDGNYVEFLLDDRGNVTQTRQVAHSGPAGDIVSTAVFPSCTSTNQKICNKPESVTDARGATTHFTYDASHGGVLTATSPRPTPTAVQPQVRMGYLPFSAYYKNFQGNFVAGPAVHRLTTTSACQKLGGAFGNAPAACAGLADEVKTTIVYGSPGVANNLLPTSTTTSSGDGDPEQTSQVVQTYDDVGNLLTVDGPLSGTEDISYFLYDANRRMTASISPDPDGANEPLPRRITRYTLSDDGLVSKTEGGTTVRLADGSWAVPTISESVEVQRDTLGRPVKQTLFSGGPANQAAEAVVQMSYDEKGRPLCTAQRMDIADFGAPLPDACIVTSPAGNHGPDRITKTIYDEADQVTAVNTVLGPNDEAKEAAYTYSDNGRVLTASDGEDRTTTYVYDGQDRLQRTTYPTTAPHGATSETVTYESVGGGVQNSPLVATMVNRAGETLALSYDALGRVMVKDVPNSTHVFDSHYRYDNLGRTTGIAIDADATKPATLSFGYDALGRMTQENHSSYGNKSFGYDLAGRREYMEWKDGVRIEYRYLVTGETKRIFEAPSVAGAITLATFDYDGRGRRTKLTRGNGTVTEYTPDAVSRLTMLTQSFPASATNDLTLGFAYNPAGQIVTNTRSNTLYSWTGNVAGSTTTPANALNQIDERDGLKFSYDAKGNLTSDGTRSYSYDAENRLKSAGTASFFYDALGRLSWHTSSGGLLDYEGSRLVTELQGGTHAILRRYVHGPGSDEPLVWYEGAGTATRRWLHADERGSIIAVSDINGAVTARNRYDEYGLPAGNNVGRFQYTGQKWLPQVGLYDYKARTYDPRLGRFVQPDPIGYGDGMNLYAYVGGDPVNLTDPTGRCEEEGGDKPNETEGDCGDIVITGRRLPADDTVTIVVGFLPGMGLYDCVTTSCTIMDWGWAGLDLVPFAKPVTAARRVYKIAKKACGCFEAGTLVNTPSGLIPIEEIAIGDLVLAVNEKTGEIAAKPVSDLIRPGPKPLYAVYVLDGDGEVETFHATDDHPWKVGGKGWLETVNLKVGDRIDTGSGAGLLVTALTLTDRIEPTYNLTVADWHTFMVGEDGAVVHNVNCKKKKTSRRSGKEAASDVPSWARGEVPEAGQSGKDFAKGLLDTKYGKGNYDMGSTSEYSKLKKRGDRGPDR